jgi:phospholipase/lecithinase/hemolysin
MFSRNWGALLPSTAIVTTLIATPAAAQPADVERLVAFGASLTDTGNAFEWLSDPANRICGERTVVPPYDTLEDLVPPGPYARGGHHFTNGATWIEVLARELALAGNARPAFRSESPKATNYAVGGARAVAGFPCRFNLPDQVNTYLSDFAATPAGTVVAIEIGGNDVQDALMAAALFGQNPAPYIQNAIGSLADNITRLYAHGARRFLLLNVPDVGQIPAVRALNSTLPGIATVANTISQAYNAALLGAVQQLSGLPAIDIRVVDVYTLLNTVLAHPAAYGFDNVTEACVIPNQPPFTCSRPDRYVFWDGIHPTRALHAIVAEQALAVLSAP